jgi:glucosylceramidase
MLMEGSSIKVYQTAKDTDDRITRKEDLSFADELEWEPNAINIYSDVEYQKFIGFGGAFTESAADTYYKLNSEKQKEIMQAYFDKENGNGYTFCRTHMNSCDFSLGNYSCDDVPGDVSLSAFNIERDKKQLIPMIKTALKYGDLQLFFSPWSPPAWMKTTGEMNRGGKLLPEYRQVWADFYSKFVTFYKEQGIEFWGLSVQNEPMNAPPWDACLYTADEEADFVKDYLAPTFKKDGLDYLKIIIWDHNKERLYDRVKNAFSDKETSDLIWGAGFHWYAGDHFEALEAVHKKWPDKYLMYTEGCKEGGPANGDWSIGERYGHEIMGDLNNYTSAWCDWNLILNKDGGPNHVNNLCDAPILADCESGNLLYEASYWYIGHFSRFIKPGSIRIGYSKFSDGLECTAFKNADGTVAVVVMNKSDIAQRFALRYEDKQCSTTCLPHSIMTLTFSE